jgi:hypothetical protein
VVRRHGRSLGAHGEPLGDRMAIVPRALPAALRRCRRRASRVAAFSLDRDR